MSGAITATVSAPSRLVDSRFLLIFIAYVKSRPLLHHSHDLKQLVGTDFSKLNNLYFLSPSLILAVVVLPR